MVNTHWRIAGAAVGPIKSSGRVGSKTLYARTVRIYPGIVRLLVSRMPLLGAITYITGLRFVYGNGRCGALGYIIPSHEICIDICSDEDHQIGIRGFRLAVTPTGICAIACVTGSGRTSQWAGSPDNFPRMLLSGDGMLRHLKGTFDVSECRKLLEPG
jgi:hypothetical protein